MLRRGFDPDQVAEVMRTSPGAEKRRDAGKDADAYVARTVEKARRVIDTTTPSNTRGWRR